MKNLDIRQAASKAGIRLWRISEELGITDSAFSKKLRRELPAAEKEKIFEIITELEKEEG